MEGETIIGAPCPQNIDNGVGGPLTHRLSQARKLHQRVCLQDLDGSNTRCGDRADRRIAQLDREGLVGLNGRVIREVHKYGFRAVPVSKIQHPETYDIKDIVATHLGVTIHRCVAHLRSPGRATKAIHGQGNRCPLRPRIVGTREGEARFIRQDRNRYGIRTQDRAIPGGGAEGDVERLIRLHQSIVDDRDGDCGGHRVQRKDHDASGSGIVRGRGGPGLDRVRHRIGCPGSGARPDEIQSDRSRALSYSSRGNFPGNQ